MSHTPHELHEEFPDLAHKITELKLNDTHFAKLAEAYHTTNRTIHRAETRVEPMDDLAMDASRKQRLKLKDDLYAMLTT